MGERRFNSVTEREKIAGQTLFELLVALGIAVLIITGIVLVITLAVRNATFSRNQAEATRYGQEALEWLRSERDQNWDNFFANSDKTWCLTSLSWPASALPCSNSDTIPGTIFLREAQLSTLASDTVEVLIEVSWTDGSGTHLSRLDTTLTDWRD